MQKYLLIYIGFGLISLLATACTLPAYGSPFATPTLLVFPTLTSQRRQLPLRRRPQITNTPNPFPTLTLTGVPTIQGNNLPSTNFCADGKATALINSFKSAVQTSNGTLLASLVSPVHGMDARLYRTGRMVNYDSRTRQIPI